MPHGGLLFVVRVPILVWARSPAAPPDVDYTTFVYTTFVRDVLIDAILDTAVRLPLQDDEWLTVVAMTDARSAVRVATRYKLYLAIRGSDLARLHQQHIFARGRAKARLSS